MNASRGQGLIVMRTKQITDYQFIIIRKKGAYEKQCKLVLKSQIK